MSLIERMIEGAREAKCSDLHLTVNMPPLIRVNGSIMALEGYPELPSKQIDDVATEMLRTVHLEKADADIDFCYVNSHNQRHRVNVYRQCGTTALAIRMLQDKIPHFEDLGLPPVVNDIAMQPRGLVLVTGPTGSGKTTSLASMIDLINSRRRCHILTLEDPIEYMHTHKRSMINQRELGVDTYSFYDALKSALREDPDVILVGEMRDKDTIAAAITAAETGHLVLSTLHTTGAAATIDRIVDVFEPHQQMQIRTQLASVLRSVISQQLLPKVDGTGRVAALEILITTDAISNLIRENKGHQINSSIQTGARMGMQSMDAHLAQLVASGTIAQQDALFAACDKTGFKKLMGIG